MSLENLQYTFQHPHLHLLNVIKQNDRYVYNRGKIADQLKWSVFIYQDLALTKCCALDNRDSVRLHDSLATSVRVSFSTCNKRFCKVSSKRSFLYIHDAFRSSNLTERKFVRGTFSPDLSREWVICVEDARWPCCYSRMLYLRKANTVLSATGEAHSSYSMPVHFCPRKLAGQCPLLTRKAERATTDPFLNNTIWWIKQPMNQTSLQLNDKYMSLSITVRLTNFPGNRGAGSDTHCRDHSQFYRKSTMINPQWQPRLYMQSRRRWWRSAFSHYWLCILSSIMTWSTNGPSTKANNYASRTDVREMTEPRHQKSPRWMFACKNVAMDIEAIYRW